MIEVLRVFIRLGLLGFGGPIAAVAMVEDDVVLRRRWLTRERFSELYAICKLLPGPVSTQMAIAVGRERAGVGGGILAGLAFVFPAFLMVLIFAILYARFSGLDGLGPVFFGMQAGALVVILLSTWRLAQPYSHNRMSWAVAALSGTATWFFPRGEPLWILGLGMIGALLLVRKRGGALSLAPAGEKFSLSGLAWVGAIGAIVGALAFDPRILSQLFWVCFKAGAFLFGTGLAIVPMLEGEVVRHYGWLTHSEFMDALAIGQVTPGPVVIASTFIGYRAAGFAGACVATLGMFLPSFINVLVLVPMIWRRFQGTAAAEGFSNWAIPAVVGGIGAVTLRLGLLTLVGFRPLMVFILAVLVVGVWRRIPAWALILGSGAVGFVLRSAF